MSDWKLIHPENVTASSTSLATHGWVLGEIRTDSQGRLYRCIKNAEGSSAFSNGLVICWKDQTTFNGECILGDNDAKYDVAGVAVGAIAAASYGWIQISGHHNAIVCDPELVSSFHENPGRGPARGTTCVEVLFSFCWPPCLLLARHRLPRLPWRR